MENRRNAAASLSLAINQGLIRKFGKLPSATIFANQFNLRAYGTKTISRETARKWLLGMAVPEIDKLVVLISWLELNLDGVFDKKKVSKKTLGDIVAKPTDNIEYHIQNCINALSKESKNVLFLAAWMLKQLEANDHNVELCEKLIQDQLATCSNCTKHQAPSTKHQAPSTKQIA